ncbi:glycoside hydrolase [Gracilaria domingensis]|nr:glycoside hydrolase [Gracilaria domingensis]
MKKLLKQRTEALKTRVSQAVESRPETWQGFKHETMGLLDRILDRVPSTPPGKDGSWRLVESVSDEFEGDALNEDKWEPFNRNWRGRAPGWFNKENVVVGDDCLQLHSRLQSAPANYPAAFHTHPFSTAFVRSKTKVKYGYFEAKVHPADSCIASAFWFARNESESWNEIDVFEVSGKEGYDHKYTMNAHVFRVGGQNLERKLHHPQQISLPFRVCDEPFTAALDWTAESITWILNGNVVRELPNDHWHEEMWVQFDCETMPNWFGMPSCSDNRDVPCCYKVYYIRAWQRE